MYRHKAGQILVALSLLLAASVPAGAQDAVPETPPELRDFRLDPPQPSPGPQAAPATQPAPTVTPPPPLRTVSEGETQPRTNASPDAVRREEAQAPARASSSTGSTGSGPQVGTAEPVAAEPVVGPTESEAATDPAPTPASPSAQSTWNITFILGLLGGAVALALAGWLLFRRRRSSIYSDESDMPMAAVPDAEPFEPVTAESKRRPSFQPVTPPATLKPAPPSPPPASGVSILFIPEKATISFTTLTVQGQLQIANESKVPAKNMELHAVLLSASERQQEAMASFFDDPTQIAPNALGEAKPGERLALSLELSVSLSEMQSFPLGDLRLLVPILVANLSYRGADGRKEEARLACMIGREAKPPKPKMGPLRLDQGPRSFAPLGQRPVYA